MSQMRPGRTYFPLLRTLTSTHLSTDSLSLHLSKPPHHLSFGRYRSFPPTQHPTSTPASTHLGVALIRCPPPVRSSASVCQRHRRPPVASRMLKRFLSGVIKMSHFCMTKSLSREQFVRAVTFSLLSKNLSKMLRPGAQPPHLPQDFKQTS